MSAVKGESTYDPYYMYGNTGEGAGAIKRWSKGYNNDFEARMDWSITSNYSDANHHPVAVVNPLLVYHGGGRYHLRGDRRRE